jgi:hypothetical protein
VLAPDRGDHFFAPVIGIEIHCMAMHNRIAQLGGATHRRVLREIILDRQNGGVLDVLRRGKMWLTRAEIDHVNALLAQFVGFGDYSHGG